LYQGGIQHILFPMGIHRLRRALTYIVILPVRAYQRLISPILPPACRYYPRCSEYMVQAIQNLGPAKGLIIGGARIGRCSPLHSGGLDPVPRTLPWRLVLPYALNRWKRFRA